MSRITPVSVSSSSSVDEARPVERLRHRAGEFGLLEVPGVDVHRDRRDLEPGGPPAPHLLQRLADRPLAHPVDEPGLLGDRDEVARRQQPVVALPAHQGLDAGEPPGARVDDRLVVQHQLVPVERLVQRGLEVEALAVGMPELGLEAARAVAAERLGLRQCLAGLREQRGRGHRRSGRRESDRGAHHAVEPAAGQRLAQRRHRDLRGPLGRERGAHRREQQRELVARQPGEHDVRHVAERLLQPRGHLLERIVAGGSAERVVEPLEPVEVDEQQRCRLGRILARHIEQRLGHRQEALAVEQPGQRIAVRELTGAAGGLVGEERELLGAVEAALAAGEFGPHLGGGHQLGEALGQQLPLQRLDEEVGRAGVEGPFDRGLVVAAAEHQDRHRLLADPGPDAPAQVEAVAVGQDRVEHHRVGTDRLEGFERPRHARRPVHVDAVLGQTRRHQVLPGGVVLDEQDSESPDRRALEGQERSGLEVKGPILPQVAYRQDRPAPGIPAGATPRPAQT
jgi:hypothetical protein